MKPMRTVKLPKTIAHEFVDFIPDVIEEGKLYVSIEYATTVHKCACGCAMSASTGTTITTPTA